jgi:osmotically-inducible protein OsmY
VKPSHRFAITVLAVTALLLTTSTAAAEPKLTDETIGLAVQTELMHGEGFSGHNIDVTVEEGVCALSGQVGSLLAKERAGWAAQSVRGVHRVDNGLEVKPATRSDPKIRGDVLSALGQDPVTETWQIDVQVDDGVVTLRGTVDSYLEKQLADAVAKRVRGARGLRNRLTIDSPQDREDDAIGEDVRARLFADARIRSGLISVEVADGRVELGGFVRSAWEKAEAQRKAREVPGVESVGTEGVRVVSDARDAMDDVELARQEDTHVQQMILDEFRHHRRILPFNVDVHVEGGVVTLTGVVDNLKAKKDAETEAERVVGVVRVKNFLRVRPKAQLKTDQQIAEEIRAVLRRDADVDPSRVTVLVYNGEARLSGQVASQHAKKQAENAAAGVTGVASVQNRLTVPGSSKRKSDPAIRQDIASELWWSPWVDADRIDVRVEQGVATLEGKVDDVQERDAALENARQGGAVTVRDQLEVESTPKLTSPP